MRAHRAVAVIVATAWLLVGVAAGPAAAAPIATLTAPSPISGGHGWLVWSVPKGRRWVLEGWHAGRTATLAAAARPQPFDATVGSDSRGRPVVTFSRCTRTPKVTAYGTSGGTGGTLVEPATGAGCRIRVLSLQGGREQTLAIPHPRGASDTTPAMWHGAVAFGRRSVGHGSVEQVMLWSPRHAHRLTTLPHGAEPAGCRRGVRCEEPVSGEVQALAFNGHAVAFVWSLGGEGLLGEEAWEDRVDVLGASKGALAGSQIGIESCAGGGPIEERYPIAALLIGDAALFAYYERGDCFTRFGTGVLRYRAGRLGASALDTPAFGFASDGHALFALLAQVPREPIEAECSDASPCSLQSLALPRFRPVSAKPTHPFI